VEGKGEEGKGREGKVRREERERGGRLLFQTFLGPVVSSESNRTPRSCTTSEVVPVPTVSDRSCDDSLLMAALDPIHIASVLSAFSCNRRELHHWVTSATQSLSCCGSLKLSSGLALASSCVSSAYMCARTL